MIEDCVDQYKSQGYTQLVNVHFCHVGEICTVLIIWESNPEVISIPIHVGKRRRYRILRFFFLYQGTRSCSTRRVRTGSAKPPPGAMVSKDVQIRSRRCDEVPFHKGDKFRQGRGGEPYKWRPTVFIYFAGERRCIGDFS